MATALPRNIQLKLDQTLAQWRQWHCDTPLPCPPTVHQVLTEGRSNYSVQVVADERAFVVRIDGLNPAVNGLSRQTEWRALQLAHQQGLAPCPRYFNPELSSLVCDFLAPDPSSNNDRPTSEVADTARLLRHIHQLPPVHSRLDLRERILRYEKQLEHRGRGLSPQLRNYRAQIITIMEQLSGSDHATTLCHNDLLQANRIYSGQKMWAIDWEYCAMGSPWFDLAVVAAGDELGESKTEELLRRYLGSEPTQAELALLFSYRCIYRYLELLWYGALAQPRQFQDLITQKLSALQLELAQS